MTNEVSEALDNLKTAVTNLMRAIESQIESHDIRNLAAAVVVTLAALEHVMRRQDGPPQL